jgi:hypothetical protein
VLSLDCGEGQAARLSHQPLKSGEIPAGSELGNAKSADFFGRSRFELRRVAPAPAALTRPAQSESREKKAGDASINAAFCSVAQVAVVAQWARRSSGRIIDNR